MKFLSVESAVMEGEGRGCWWEIYPIPTVRRTAIEAAAENLIINLRMRLRAASREIVESSLDSRSGGTQLSSERREASA